MLAVMSSFAPMCNSLFLFVHANRYGSPSPFVALNYQMGRKKTPLKWWIHVCVPFSMKLRANICIPNRNVLENFMDFLWNSFSVYKKPKCKLNLHTLKIIVNIKFDFNAITTRFQQHHLMAGMKLCEFETKIQFKDMFFTLKLLAIIANVFT